MIKTGAESVDDTWVGGDEDAWKRCKNAIHACMRGDIGDAMECVRTGQACAGGWALADRLSTREREGGHEDQSQIKKKSFWLFSFGSRMFERRLGMIERKRLERALLERRSLPTRSMSSLGSSLTSTGRKSEQSMEA